MDIRSFDLNLLVVFDAMLEHRGVTRAAQAIRLSQPATSAAVARLRTLFNDPLFVRVGNQMRPTPRAELLAGPVRLVIATLAQDILQAQSFDAASANTRFSILAPDITEILLLPALSAYLARHAPGAKLRTLSVPQHLAAETLASGQADLAVGYFPDLQKAGFFQQKLFANDWVCITRKNHPILGNPPTLKQYLAAAHVLVLPDGRGHVIDQFLSKQGLERRIELEISHYMSLLPLLSQSDLVATVPRDLGTLFTKHSTLRMVPAPVKTPHVEVHQFWHSRVQKYPAHVWLRGVVHQLFSATNTLN